MIELEKKAYEMNKPQEGSFHQINTVVSLLNTYDALLGNYNLACSIADKINAPLGNALLSLSTVLDNLSKYKVTKTSFSQQEPSTIGIYKELTSVLDKLMRVDQILEQLNDIKPENKSRNISSFSISSSLHEVLNHTSKILKDHNISVKTNILGSPYITSCSSALNQCLIGIIYNICLFSVPGREPHRITLNVSKVDTKNSILIFVKDNGVGMTEEDVNKAFDPLGCIEASNPPMGYSLVAVSNLIINTLKGHFDVDINQTGTSFKVLLPSKPCNGVYCSRCDIKCK